MTLYTVTALNGAIKFHPLFCSKTDVVIENGDLIEVINEKIQQSGEI